jgi:hypothetical protein
MEQKILITGHPRSGGTTLARILMGSGFNIPHEYFRAPSIGIDSPIHAVEGWFKAGEPLVEWKPVIHRTRHPLKVIASLRTGNAPFLWNWAHDWVGVDRRLPQFERSCRFYIAFKEVIDARNPVYRFKMENLQEEWPHFLKAAGLEYQPMDETVERKNIISDDAEPLEWSDLGEFEQPIREIALEWGYDV